jgi:hypothetical protein
LIKKYIIVIFLLGGLQAGVLAQGITLDAKNRPLSELLVELRDSYSMSFSYNAAELRKYSISVNEKFDSGEEALNFLLKDLPFSYEKSGEVYIIFSSKKDVPEIIKSFVLAGQIVERKSNEALPYSTVIINGKGGITDENGYFQHRSSDSIFELKVSHLGYYQLDTLLLSTEKHRIMLTPAIEQLEEVVITDKVLETFLYTENRAGVLRMNHKVTRFLPGSSNNSVFNLLRLQTGITASAEALENLIIWGSYEGQSRIYFDDILLFGLSNFNDNIGTVNPYIVKDIKIMKAAYGAPYGDCVGGIAEITGKDGNQKNFSLDLSLNNYTVNSMIETPLGRNSSLIFAFRHTYRNLYDVIEWDFSPNRERTEDSEVKVLPDYLFRDLNVKYSFRNENDFYIRLSMLGGQDDFSYNVSEMLTRWFRLERKTSESSFQKGSSFIIGKNGKNGLSAQFGMSFSDLDSEYENDQQVVNTFNDNIRRRKVQESFSSTSEAKLNFKTSWAINHIHNLEAGLSWVGNHTEWVEDTAGINFINQEITGNRINLMAQDRISLGRISLIPGFRLTNVPDLNKSYFSPRFSAALNLSEKMTFSLAAGIHRQYLTRNSVEDEYGNFRYMWTVANDAEYPVLMSRHLTTSLAFEKNNTQINITPYYKTTQGLTRYVNYRLRNIENIYEGKGKSYGLDFYLKQNFLDHTAWISYTLSETREWFEHFPDRDYRHAPHDQRHEIKLALLLDFDPVFFSTNYVYGSGFPNPYNIKEDRIPYQRWDIALSTKFKLKKFFGEAGISVLNVLNRENLLYYNLERIPTFQTSTIRLYQQSVPFTPTLFVRVVF